MAALMVIVPPFPLTFETPQAFGSSASSPNGTLTPVAFVAVAMAPVRCVVAPRTPANSDGRTSPIRTSMYWCRPWKLDSGPGGILTSTETPLTPLVKPLAVAALHAAVAGALPAGAGHGP